MPGQNIGRKQAPQRNIIAEIAQGFMEEENRKRKFQQEQQAAEKNFKLRNPVAAIQGMILKKHQEQGYEALTPKERAFVDKEAYGVTPSKLPESMTAKQQYEDQKYKKLLAGDDIESTSLTPEVKKEATTLRNEFMKSDMFKQAEVIKRSARAMDEAFRLSTSPDSKSRIASDQALGVLFQKMLDPSSVVRESEYARTPEGASALSRMQGIMPRLIKGGLALTDNDRQELLNMAQKLQSSAEELLGNRVQGFRDLSSRYGVPEDLVLMEYAGLGNQTKSQAPERQDADALAAQHYSPEEIAAYKAQRGL